MARIVQKENKSKKMAGIVKKRKRKQQKGRQKKTKPKTRPPSPT